MSTSVDVYARRSAKGDKKQASTSGQVAACRAVLAERGLTVGEVYVDDGTVRLESRRHAAGRGKH